MVTYIGVISNVKTIVENNFVFCWFKKIMMLGNIMLPTVSLAGIPTIVIAINFRKKKRPGMKLCILASPITVH